MRSIAAGYLWAALLLLLLVFPAAPNSAGAQVPTTPLQQRAVVLGGGGLTGQAWEIGILKGLRDAGIDLTQADLVVGASAGSVVGVQLRSAQSLDAFYEALLAPPTITSPVDPTRIDLPYFQENVSHVAGDRHHTGAADRGGQEGPGRDAGDCRG